MHINVYGGSRNGDIVEITGRGCRHFSGLPIYYFIKALSQPEIADNRKQ